MVASAFMQDSDMVHSPSFLNFGEKNETDSA